VSIKFEDEKRLTNRQKVALDKAAERVKVITGSALSLWDIAFNEEIRPGRGHDITAWSADGEHIATQYLDPYGHGALVIAATDLIHNDSDEEHFNSLGNCKCPGGGTA
jgi:hypothetical protein